MKNKNDNELKLIKDFITKIDNGTINNKNKAGNELRYLFGEDIENIEPEEKYEESIAERVKKRRQNKETDRDKQRNFAP